MPAREHLLDLVHAVRLGNHLGQLPVGPRVVLELLERQAALQADPAAFLVRLREIERTREQVKRLLDRERVASAGRRREQVADQRSRGSPTSPVVREHAGSGFRSWRPR